jgi:hypothetical protein
MFSPRVMVRLHDAAFRLGLPTLTAVRIRGEALQRLHSPREVRGHQRGMQRRFQMVMHRVVIRFHRGVFGVSANRLHGFGRVIALGPFW